jgi:hypothetical protein
MKKFTLTLLTLLTMSLTSNAQEAPVLGLAERRAVKDYQDTIFPELKKEILSASGFDLVLDVKWEQIARIGESEKYKDDEYWGRTIFKPLINSLKAITADNMGKEALKAKLKKIVIMFDEKTAPSANFAAGLTWNAGILTINWTPYSNTNEYFMKERATEIQKLVESKL